MATHAPSQSTEARSTSRAAALLPPLTANRVASGSEMSAHDTLLASPGSAKVNLPVTGRSRGGALIRNSRVLWPTLYVVEGSMASAPRRELSSRLANRGDAQGRLKADAAETRHHSAPGRIASAIECGSLAGPLPGTCRPISRRISASLLLAPIHSRPAADDGYDKFDMPSCSRALAAMVDP